MSDSDEKASEMDREGYQMAAKLALQVRIASKKQKIAKYAFLFSLVAHILRIRPLSHLLLARP